MCRIVDVGETDVAGDDEAFTGFVVPKTLSNARPKSFCVLGFFMYLQLVNIYPLRDIDSTRGMLRLLGHGVLFRRLIQR